MNRALLPEMLHCLSAAANCADMTILERQRYRPRESYFNETELGCFQGLIGGESALGEAVTRPVKPDPGFENGWPELGRFEISSSGFGSAISRTASLPPAEKWSPAPEKMGLAVGSQSFKKRKAQSTKVVVVREDDVIKDKKLKGYSEDGESKITTEQNKNKNSNRESSASEVENQKTDYIHVRARRGQATDSHSLAERVRREKISERMKYLQDLVPGCNKITGKAGMLDEIINYVQSLQRQVEFLSMKLATVNPRSDINNVFAKEIFPINFATTEMASQAYLQLSPVEQMLSGCGLEMAMSSPEMVVRRTISAPISFPEPFLDSSCFTNSANWDGDLQNFYNVEFHQGRATTSFQPQPFIGAVDAGDLKMEM